MTAVPKKFYTPKEYLEREWEVEYKSEYFGGELRPLGDFAGILPGERSGFPARHNAIRGNLAYEIGMRVRKNGYPCFSADQRLYLPENGFFGYPDFLVFRGTPAIYGDDDAVMNPVLLAEVRSRSTFEYDGNEKLRWYQDIPTLREYLILDSRRVGIELWRKLESGPWALVTETVRPDGELYLESVGLPLQIADVYAGVDDLPPVIF
jgi:Uma2 family endonuclease